MIGMFFIEIGDSTFCSSDDEKNNVFYNVKHGVMMSGHEMKKKQARWCKYIKVVSPSSVTWLS